jgi:hypothetical protein
LYLLLSQKYAKIYFVQPRNCILRYAGVAFMTRKLRRPPAMRIVCL